MALLHPMFSVLSIVCFPSPNSSSCVYFLVFFVCHERGKSKIEAESSSESAAFLSKSKLDVDSWTGRGCHLFGTVASQKLLHPFTFMGGLKWQMTRACSMNELGSLQFLQNSFMDCYGSCYGTCAW